MGTIDIVILACFLPAIFIGLKNGLIRQLVALAVVVLGIWLAVRFSDVVAAWITAAKITTEPFWAKTLSFVLVFVAVALVLNLVGKLLEKVLDIAMLGWLNRLLGMVVAIATGALVIGTLIYLVNSANSLIGFIPEEQIEQSRFYKPLLTLVQQVFPYLKTLF
ncbi:MAG: CvpA family protein [Bacteroidales bacterium]|nr:CvpA family protein [Bacteroidales bacterium]